MAARMSQEELRQLMRETKAKKVARIDSPLARYDAQGKLSCAICNVPVNGEANWSNHLVDSGHKKKIEELKNKQKKLTAPAEVKLPPAAQKRSMPAFKEPIAKKVSKFDNISEFSKKEMTIKQAAASTNAMTKKSLVDVDEDDVDDDEEENKGQIEQQKVNASQSVADVPSDFFDDGIKPMEGVENSSNVEQAAATDANLPKGFFDDPVKDARARNEKQTSIDAEMDTFFKEIAQETLISEEVIEQDIESSRVEKLIDEIDEQINNWAKVDHFQKKIEEIHRKKLEEKASTSTSAMVGGDNMNENDDDDDDDDDDDIDGDDFWRAKSLA